MELTSVESLCNLLARSRLLSGDEVRALRLRWLHEAGDAAADPRKFARWLVEKEYVTDYQSGLLLLGKWERHFLNEYKILDRIGQGRMAGVYKAVHRLGQVVAIKVLPPSKAKDANLLARFQRETRLATRLVHRNVVRTFQVGEDDGLHYLVMEYLDGETLQNVIAMSGKLRPGDAAAVVHQALTGLHYLHEEAIVHRDLSPANLMLLGPGEYRAPGQPAQALVKILDIGTGRALFDEGGAGGGPVDLTAPGSLLGEPDYMAPEQARDAHTADIRADIYSLGCTLYHALAGQPPFPDDNVVRKLVRHASERPRPLKNFNPLVPDSLQHVVDTMMAKDPALRFPTPALAAKELEFLIGGTPAQRPAVDEARHTAYLKWLEAQEDGRAAPVRAAAPAPAPVAAPAPVPVAYPVAAPAAAPAPVAAPAPRPAAPVRAAAPQAARRSARTASPTGVPVSLRGAMRLSWRDCIMVTVGGVGALLAVGVAWLVAVAFHR
jgi:eukaryotic-like serine/threonine-protein kinase